MQQAPRTPALGNSRWWVSTLLLFLSTAAFAAPIPTSQQPLHKERSRSMIRTLNALKMKQEAGMAELKKQGHWGYQNLEKLAFEELQPMQLRWRALTRLAKIGGKNSIETLEKAARSDEWFMRSASLVAFRRVNRKQAVRWARKLIEDPALLVRAEAVSTIRQMSDRGAKRLLWNQLYNQQNIRNGQSVWLRRRIVETYSRLADASDIPRLIYFLRDQDTSLHPAAIEGLERLTRKSFRQKGKEQASAARQWQTWYSKNKDRL